ncbi:hypothetical protein [Streptomyces sp. XH2]|uniref:hypothetical protein n=1 Tax=Streptomyces sp. XH2 TaxID=3412483 RepID=UPI003C7C0697
MADLNAAPQPPVRHPEAEADAQALAGLLASWDTNAPQPRSHEDYLTFARAALQVFAPGTE